MNLQKTFLLSLSLAVLIFTGCSTNLEPVPSENSQSSNQEQTTELAQIDDVEVVIRESSPVQISVVISGNFRNGCERMGDVSQKMENNTFIITVPVKTEGDMCTQALVPFEKSISLDTEGLSDGTYTVDVNGKKESFQLSGNSSMDPLNSSLSQGDFKKNDEHGVFVGTAYVQGYGEIIKQNKSFCEKNCEKVEHVYFNVLQSSNQAFVDFIQEHQGNSFVGVGSIGLGCYQNGTIFYENDADEFGTNGAGFGSKSFTLNKELTNKIVSATKEKPITLEITKLLYTSGRGAPECYSNFTYVKEFISSQTQSLQNEKPDTNIVADSTPKGTIEGSMGYPSEGIPPDIKVCADNIETKETFCTSERINDKKYKYRVGYKLDVPPGTYHVYEMQTLFDYHENPKGYKAYYSDFVTCGESVECTSHTPIEVKVTAGSTIKNIDPVDFNDMAQMEKLKK